MTESTARRVAHVLRVVYTGRPGQPIGRRVGQGAVVGLLTLGAFGAVLPEPETEKAGSVAQATPSAAATTEPAPSPVATTEPAAAPSPTAVLTTAPAPRPTTARPVASPTRATVVAPIRTTTRPPAPSPRPKPSTCGAPANPWGYHHCGAGAYITSPPSAFCSYFPCIDSFWESTNGYVMRCDDGMYSHSGGRRGSCSHHGGNDEPLYR